MSGGRGWRGRVPLERRAACLRCGPRGHVRLPSCSQAKFRDILSETDFWDCSRGDVGVIDDTSLRPSLILIDTQRDLYVFLPFHFSG